MRSISHLALLVLSLLLLQGLQSWAKRGGGFGFGRKTSSSKGGTSGSRRPAQGTHTQPGGYPRQPQNPNQNPAPGNYPGGGGYPGGGSYPGAGGYPGGGSYPGAGGYPGGGSYPGAGGYPGRGVNPGGYPVGGGFPARPGNPNQYGGGAYPAAYPGGVAGYPNWNPNNQILSPRYGGAYGAGGYGKGGSPFSHTVQSMGMGPSFNSKGFGRNAAMAAGMGAIAGMAVGYGLGRFPRPHFHFHSPEEEYYYNHYMYRRYGSRSTDTNDFGRDYDFKPAPQSYDTFMDNCMKRNDLLPKQSSISHDQQEEMPAPATQAKHDPQTTQLPGNTSTNDSSSTSEKPQEKVHHAGWTEQEEDKDEDTVDIMEIGYPELIEQLKARRCVELYLVYSERYMEKRTADVSSRGGEGRSLLKHWSALLFAVFVLLL